MLTTFKDLEQMFRFSEFLAKSPLLPEVFRGNPGSVMIALNMAQRLRMDPLMVCQNIVIVHGNAGLSGKFAIALLNRSPKYSRIEYRYCNGKDYTGGMQVIGHRKDDPGDKRPDVGTAVTLEMARAEGWTSNKKWQTMPEQMMRYRAAAFFARAFVPEELLGMQTAEELEDVGAGAPMYDVRGTMYDVKSEAAKPRGLRIAKAKVATDGATKGGDKSPDVRWTMDDGRCGSKAASPQGHEQVEQDGAQVAAVKAVEPEKMATKGGDKSPDGRWTRDEDMDDSELLLEASLEEGEKALAWMEKSLRGSGATWGKVYKVCEAVGVRHPEIGCGRGELAAFALAVRCDGDLQAALVESGIIFEK